MIMETANEDRQKKRRIVSNWLANVVNCFHEQYRRPDYKDLLSKVEALSLDLPKIKRILIYLNNTEDQK